MNPKLIVIDTNVLLSAVLSPNGTARQALDKAYQQFKIAQSEETYQELKTRIYKPKFNKYISDQDREQFLEVVKKSSHFIEITSQINICRDPDDNKFLELIFHLLMFATNTCRVANHFFLSPIPYFLFPSVPCSLFPVPWTSVAFFPRFHITKDCNAEYLITGDQDLLSLKTLAEYQNKIMTPKNFLTLKNQVN
jgi:uncharacterized protein